MNPVTCPNCGSTTWHRFEQYSGTDFNTLATAGDHVDYRREGTKYNAHPDDWECENDHTATDDIAEALDDLESNQ